MLVWWGKPKAQQIHTVHTVKIVPVRETHTVHTVKSAPVRRTHYSVANASLCSKQARFVLVADSLADPQVGQP